MKSFQNNSTLKGKNSLFRSITIAVDLSENGKYPEKVN